MNQQHPVLNQEEISFFRTFGYLLFPRLMADRIEAIQQAFERVWTEHGGGHDGKPHEGAAHSCLVPFIDQSEELSSLLDDPRILGIARALLGDDFITAYTTIKEHEIGRFQAHVTDWEIEEYREVY